MTIVEQSLTHHMELGADFLAHYGVKGMRWGVHRSTAPVKVSTTVRNGKSVKTTGGKRQATSADAVRVAVIKQKSKKNSLDQISNKELEVAIRRMQLEQQFNNLHQRKSLGRQLASAILGQIGDKEAVALGGVATGLTGNAKVGFGVGAAARFVGTKPSGGKKKKK